MSAELDDDEVYCRDCGAVINDRAEICPECGIRQKEPEPSSSSDNNPGLAAVASIIIPGLGKVYNGQIAKGIIIIIIGAVTVVLAITVVGLIIAVSLWIWLMYDAYQVADRGPQSRSRGGTPPSPRTDIKQPYPGI